MRPNSPEDELETVKPKKQQTNFMSASSLNRKGDNVKEKQQHDGSQGMGATNKNYLAPKVPSTDIPISKHDTSITTLTSITNDEEDQTKILFGSNVNSQRKIDISTDSLRWSAGQAMASFADLINDNIITARYGTIASITLLTLYGISKTPVFFRYKTVSEIPSQYFTDRKTLYGRIIHVAERDAMNSKRAISTASAGNNTSIENVNEEPVVCYIRHLSPAGRMLNRAAFEYSMKRHPKAQLRGEDKMFDESDLLKVEIAGVKAPPYYNSPSHLEQEGEWLRRLAEKRTYVSCQLLSRRIERSNKNSNTASNTGSRMNDNNEAAICHIKYRPGMNLFRSDLGESLVRYGRSSLASGIHVENPITTTIDGSSSVDHLRLDASYMEKLGKAEFEAVKESAGMWGDEFVREERPDLVEEADFEATAGIFQRIWRWLKNR